MLPGAIPLLNPFHSLRPRLTTSREVALPTLPEGSFLRFFGAKRGLSAKKAAFCSEKPQQATVGQ
eukprot:3046568-Alexandrium_andersonii.AAC.1